jgi:hypothetical protein
MVTTFGLSLLQIIDDRLLTVAVRIPAHVQRELIEIDLSAHFLNQLRLEGDRNRPGLGRGIAK